MLYLCRYSKHELDVCGVTSQSRVLSGNIYTVYTGDIPVPILSSDSRFILLPGRPALQQKSKLSTNTGIYSLNFGLASTLSQCCSLPQGHCHSIYSGAVTGARTGSLLQQVQQPREQRQGQWQGQRHLKRQQLQLLCGASLIELLLRQSDADLQEGLHGMFTGMDTVSNKSLRLSAWRSITACMNSCPRTEATTLVLILLATVSPTKIFIGTLQWLMQALPAHMVFHHRINMQTSAIKKRTRSINSIACNFVEIDMLPDQLQRQWSAHSKQQCNSC